MTPLIVAAGFIIVISGYLAGAGLSYLFRLNTAQITAVSVETAFQNGSISFVLLTMNFPEPLGTSHSQLDIKVYVIQIKYFYNWVLLKRKKI